MIYTIFKMILNIHKWKNKEDTIVRVSNFNFYSSPANMEFESSEGEYVNLTMHHRIAFRSHLQPDAGSDNSSLQLKGSLQIPDNRNGLEFLGPLYDLYKIIKKDNQDINYIQFHIEAASSYLKITNSLFPSFLLRPNRE